MAWCLIKSEEQAFRKALLDKKIDPFKIADWSSEQRRTLFEKYVSVNNAKNINALYESKLLLKNQITGFKTWVKRTAGLKVQIKRDIITKIERLNELGLLNPPELKAFKEDLVRSRLGLDISIDEAQDLNKLSEKRTESKEVWEKELNKNPEWSTKPHETRGEWINNKTRLEYGLDQVAIENYVSDLKLEARKIDFKKHPFKATAKAVGQIPSVFKSLMASLDNSFFGRQGIKNLFGNRAQKRIWFNAFLKSFKDIKLELFKTKSGIEPMDLIKADIYSRPNSINGKYKAGDYRLNVLSEEAFPTSLPEKVPGFGRLFKASETAFSGGALRMRADLADLLIAKADETGLNTLNPDVARPMGHLVGSLTGRGSLGKGEAIAHELNVLLFSARFFKSNVDTLTAHQFDPKATPFTKKVARQNLLSISAHIAGILMIAKFLDPDSVDEDPRSTNFGKVKIFGKWTDITGGMRGLVTLIFKLMPTQREGVWGSWSKSTAGNWVNLQAGQFGQQDGVDLLMDSIFLNKLSPVASIARDALRGEMFGGEPFDIKKSIVESITPLSIQTFNDVKDEKFGTIVATMISEFVGLGVSTYKFKSSWESRTSKEMKDFKTQVGKDLFKQANEDYNRAYNIWLDEVQEDPKYKKLSDDGKKDLKSDARSALKDKILLEYGYLKKKTIKTQKQLVEDIEKKTLVPK